MSYSENIHKSSVEYCSIRTAVHQGKILKHKGQFSQYTDMVSVVAMYLMLEGSKGIQIYMFCRLIL